MNLQVCSCRYRESYFNFPAGAVVASPTFSLPEFIGGTRNWCVSDMQFVAHWFFITEKKYRDYRASWIRDASFTLYALIRLGFTREADGTFTIHLFGA